MQIQVLSVTSETVQGPRGAYNVVEVAYKNLTFQGKVESKKLMPFGAGKNTAITMANAKPAEVYDIEVIKNDKGYNDWVKATKSSGVSTVQTASAVPSAGSTASTTGSKTGWETPEERAKKQVYIIRQSSLSTAVAALTAAGKTVPPVTDVIKYARELESYVFGQDTDSVVGQDVGSIEELDEDPIVF